ncbi:diguanylate cyclase [Paenibacillus methanolicus]|uniref:Diguanylate cyclase (GGDEF)-like protein n=1 Tax=Paenibacillus methanolicus TaxID=582686 RepID=A0A5S5CJI5_9BACL|nr:diguanylate cyclase [Paenibacillus methanolicus]TYP79173.1 diguanylate cyclase (GGDEF)-like protein [Paenibacillus methanolicus]
MHLYDGHRRGLYPDILRSCWLITALYVLCTGVQLFFTEHDVSDFFWYAIVFPALKMAAINGFMGWLFRKERPYAEYQLIVGVNLFICIIIVSLYELSIVFYCLIIPLLLSLYFYSRRLIVFTLVQALLSVVGILGISSVIRANLSVSELIMLAALLVATALIINNLRKHAFALSRELVTVTQEKQDLQTKNTLMEKLSRVDSATGLYNHRSFHEHLTNVMAVSEAHALHVHLVLLDIDNFKRVNDTYGHAVGDTVIQFVAGQLQAFQDADDFVSRYGGEEFAVLCAGKHMSRVIEQMEAMRQAISEMTHEQLNGEAVTVSIGVRKLEAGMSREELFHQADMALYQAKRTGKNRTIAAG